MISVTVRLDDELGERVDAAEGASRQEKIVGLIERGLDAAPGLKAVLLSETQIASLDQTAARMGLTREAAIELFLKERILKEFVEERQRQIGRPKRAAA
jgi:hypothetical protein